MHQIIDARSGHRPGQSADFAQAVFTCEEIANAANRRAKRNCRGKGIAGAARLTNDTAGDVAANIRANQPAHDRARANPWVEERVHIQHDRRGAAAQEEQDRQARADHAAHKCRQRDRYQLFLWPAPPPRLGNQHQQAYQHAHQQKEAVRIDRHACDTKEDWVHR